VDFPGIAPQMLPSMKPQDASELFSLAAPRRFDAAG
jgi:hypothetical protein